MSSPPSSSFTWPPLGESVPAAAVSSAVFFLGAALCVVNLKRSTFRLYMIGGALAATFRGVSLAIKAASAHSGESTEGQAIVSAFFAGAGFGIAIAVQMLVVAGWLRNTTDDAKPALWRPLRLALIAVLFPSVIVFGPILGLAAALVQYSETPPSQDAVNTATKLRKAAVASMLAIASLNALVVMLCVWTSVRARGYSLSLTRHASQTIVWLVPGTLFLVWAGAFRVQGTFVRPWTLSDEALLYPLQVLPEMLQLLWVWCVPLVAARVHLSDRFQVWWKEAHPDGPEVAPFGGFASEPQPLPSWAAQAAQGLDKEGAAQRSGSPSEAGGPMGLSPGAKQGKLVAEVAIV